MPVKFLHAPRGLADQVPPLYPDTEMAKLCTRFPHVTIHEGDTKRIRLEFRSDDTAQLDEVLAEMGKRLDTAKGYKEWDGS